jgi:hypothetical protein
MILYQNAIRINEAIDKVSSKKTNSMFAQNNSQFLADTVYFTQNLRLIGHKQE